MSAGKRVGNRTARATDSARIENKFQFVVTRVSRIRDTRPTSHTLRLIRIRDNRHAPYEGIVSSITINALILIRNIFLYFNLEVPFFVESI